jgi:multicomponent Na+:H+ antiporter subunit E
VARYLVSFVWELLTANLAVAYQVLAPSLPIEPAVVEVPLRVETDLAITTIANSITLTPGTLTMDYDSEANSLYVHTIDGRDRDAIVAPIRAWEDLALRIFDEAADPGDPVPRPRATPATESSSATGGEAVRPGGSSGEDAGADGADRGGNQDG